MKETSRKHIIIIFAFLALLFFRPNAYLAQKDIVLTNLAGTWIGYGAGEEVRFRDKARLLTLTVTHKTEFVFHVNENGEIQGEGTIVYDLTNNTTGLDNLVASVHSLMGLAQVPSIGVKGPKGDAAQGIGDKVTDAPGVTKIQYVAPHLKFGPETRHFKFTGRIKEGTIKDKSGREKQEVLIELDEVLNFALIGGEPNNTLIAEYEVNRVKTESTFPCWSPFIEGSGIIREGAGGIYIAEFQEQGTHRKGKKVWEEYSYVWVARKVSSDKGSSLPR